MRLDVFFTPGELAAGELAGRRVVVIDVLRATSSMVEALANGARAVLPTATVEEAVRRAQELGRDAVLLCGERGGERVHGFDRGNSPREFTRERVDGQLLVMSTTNGTPALLACTGAASIRVGSFLNLSAVVESLADGDEDIALLCAGREGHFALEDSLCAGAIARGLGTDAALNDAASAALALAEAGAGSVARALQRTAAARSLHDVGHGDDVEFCAALDRHDIVPEFHDRQVMLP